VGKSVEDKEKEKGGSVNVNGKVRVKFFGRRERAKSMYMYVKMCKVV
jgi:hypothetical protein